MANVKTDNECENLCDSCEWGFAECCAENFKYGEGVGQDNIIECDQHSETEH